LAPVSPVAHTLHQSSRHKALQQSENRRLAEARSGHDLGQDQCFAFMLKGLQHLASAQHDLNTVVIRFHRTGS
jgi:hypothetical protein